MTFGLFGQKTSKITRQTLVGLTEAGKRTAEKELARGPTFAILSTLEEIPHCSIGKLAEETQIDIDEVKERVRLLAKQGLVRVQGSEV